MVAVYQVISIIVGMSPVNEEREHIFVNTYQDWVLIPCVMHTQQ